jgi:hypothetical protein
MRNATGTIHRTCTGTSTCIVSTNLSVGGGQQVVKEYLTLLWNREYHLPIQA